MFNYIIFLAMFLTAFVSAQLCIFLFYKKRRIHLNGLLGVILSVFIYSLFYSFELICPNLTFMKLFTGIEYIGIASIPAFWVIMALEYTNKSRYITKKLYMLLFSLPMVLVALNITNDYHHLFYKSYTVDIADNLYIANLKPGIVYVICVIFVNVCFIVGNSLYLIFYRKENSLYKKRSFKIMLTSFIPWIGYWIYMSRITSIRIDIVPIFMGVFCLIYTYALFKSNIFETATIARHVVFDNISEAILVLDQENKIIDMNNIAEKIFNIKSKLAIGQDVCTEFKEYQEIIKYIYEEKETSFNCEIKIKNKLYYFKGKLTLINNNRGKGKVIVLSDNTEQVLMIKKLEYYGITDVLTGVYNRKYFYKIAKEKIEACSDKKHMSLLMMDIDKFKIINDTYGHPTGDIVLKKVMNICKELLGKKYYIGRYGGEEFLILLDNANSEKALEIGETIRRRIENLEILHDNKCIKITSSFGIFTSVRERDLENMIKFADKALYEAKSLGRNRVSIKMGNS